MDLRYLLDRPTAAERAAVDEVLGPPPSGWDGGEFTHLDGHVAHGGHEARARRHLLLPALHAVQDAVGSVSKGALGYISERLTVPPAEAYGVATFYALIDTRPRPATLLHVCDDIVCSRYGADELKQSIAAELGPSGGDESGVGWLPSPCLGQCDRAPAVMTHRAGVGYHNIAPAQPAMLSDLQVDELPAGPIHQDRSTLTLLRRIGVVDPGSLDAYRANGGYEGLTRAITLGPRGVIEAMDISGLRGRGGAAFPIGLKWRGVADADGEDKYIIANGDESEPGTFKDRILMEGDPFAIVEAMTIAGFATGATKGFVYVRGEYPVAERRLTEAVSQATQAGLLGSDVAGAGFVFDIEIRRGAGAYICGEETALFASIEGLRGEPRQKPPFPTEHGVFGKPTSVNNIETLVAALAVLDGGAEQFAAIGTERSTGPKLFCISGDVARPGLYEVPFGTTLRDLMDLAGGVRQGKAVGAVLVGGAAGSFVDPDTLDMELTFEGAAEARTGLGSGAVIVFDETTDFGSVLRRIAQFFRDESCGQCVPCRIGTVRQEEALARLAAGRPLGAVAEEMQRLDDLARVMADASICGLGQTAASAVQSAIRLGLMAGAAQ
ncbi:MAG TPA: NAD(P)H-dependent oxidoreductase subunit E [Acidimicrobiia bacterium]|nr:NAD(P)H-dependent oxidoreductase subunit E [Acidimicrobiia bacterium]